MRENLFRGKTVIGKAWIAGNLGQHYHTKEWFIQYPNECGTLKTELVIPETVGQYTGLTDKNGVKIFFDSDILEIKNYEYHEKHCNGYYIRKTDLRFTIHQGLLEVGYKLINPPKGLDHITLAIIFNLENPKNGKRLYFDYNRQNLEVIGNIHDNQEVAP